MMGLLENMLKTSSTPFARKMTNSFIQENKSTTWNMDVPLMNVALSGQMDVGFQSGITIFAGPSRHYKSLYCLTMLNQWFKHNINPEEAVAILFDTEYGITDDYLQSFPYIVKYMDRIIHMPVNTVEELRHEIAIQIETLYDEYKTSYKKAPKSTQKPNVFLMVDSIGQVASKKETIDAVDNKSTADMTRAKQIKSLFRIITSKVKMLGIPTVIVAHTYSEMSLFPKQVVSGGCVIKGTKIQMYNGIKKPIEEIKKGELVKTLLGDKKVTNIWNPDTLDKGFTNTYKIEFEDGYSVNCSDKHKFLIKNKDTYSWVEAKNLLETDDVVSI